MRNTYGRRAPVARCDFPPCKVAGRAGHTAQHGNSRRSLGTPVGGEREKKCQSGHRCCSPVHTSSGRHNTPHACTSATPHLSVADAVPLPVAGAVAATVRRGRVVAVADGDGHTGAAGPRARRPRRPSAPVAVDGLGPLPHGDALPRRAPLGGSDGRQLLMEFRGCDECVRRGWRQGECHGARNMHRSANITSPAHASVSP